MSFDYEEAKRDIIDAGGDPDYLDYYHADQRDAYLRKMGLNPKSYGAKEAPSVDGSVDDVADGIGGLLGLIVGGAILRKERKAEKEREAARRSQLQKQQKIVPKSAEIIEETDEIEEEDDWEDDEEVVWDEEAFKKSNKIRDDLYDKIESLENKREAITETEEELIRQYEPAVKAVEELKDDDDVYEILDDGEDLKRELRIKTILRKMISLNQEKGFALWKEALLRCSDNFFRGGGGEYGLLCVYREGNKAMTDFIAQDEEVRTIFFSKTTYSIPGQAVVLELLKDDRFEEANQCLEARYSNKRRFSWDIEFEDILDEIEISDFTEELYQFADKWIEKIESKSEKKRFKEKLNDWMESEKELEK